MSGSSKFARFDRLLNTVSSFVGKGKKKALELVKDDQIARETIPLGEQDIIKLEKVVCKLYNEHQCDRVDELCYKMFCTGNNKSLFGKPPQACKLSSIYIWRCALDPQSPDIGPENQRWQLRDGQLEMVWTVLTIRPLQKPLWS